MFFLTSFFHTLRIGPSASEAGAVAGAAEEDGLVQLVKSLSHIKSLIDDPKMRGVIQNLAPQLLTTFGSEREVEKAKAGEPASSRPGLPAPSSRPGLPAPAPVEPASPEIVDPMPPPPVPPKKEKGSPSPTEGSGGDGDEVNSSTHRAAHARLTRRMERCTAINFPNMTRLWNGSRKDIYRVNVTVLQSGLYM